MAEQNVTMNDQQLTQALQRSRGRRLAGTLLLVLGAALIVVGILLSGSVVMIVLGAVLGGVGQLVRDKAKGQAHQQAFDAMAPALLGELFDDVDTKPAVHLLNVEDTNIPLPSHSYCAGTGYVRAAYRGLPLELCTVTLTDTDDVYREETGMWERNEHPVYTGQWLVCELGVQFPTGLTFWPRGKLDGLLRFPAVKTEDEVFNKQFSLSCDNEQWALRFLDRSRMERLRPLMDGAFAPFSVCLRSDGRLYIAVNSGRGFFDAGKGRETPEQLRRRFAGELRWFTELIDVFRPV